MGLHTENLFQNPFTTPLSTPITEPSFRINRHGFRERGMRRFKSALHAQRFLSAHAAVYNLFNLGRHLVSAKNYRLLRENAFSSWKCARAL